MEEIRQPEHHIKVAYNKYNSYGDLVDDPKDAVCIGVDFASDVDETRKHVAFIMLEKRFHQTIISAEEHIKLNEGGKIPPVGNYIGTATEVKEEMLAISKALHEFLKDYDQAIQELE